jgi:hypothetical protein
VDTHTSLLARLRQPTPDEAGSRLVELDTPPRYWAAFVLIGGPD